MSSHLIFISGTLNISVHRFCTAMWPFIQTTGPYHHEGIRLQLVYENYSLRSNQMSQVGTRNEEHTM